MSSSLSRRRNSPLVKNMREFTDSLADSDRRTWGQYSQRQRSKFHFTAGLGQSEAAPRGPELPPVASDQQRSPEAPAEASATAVTGTHSPSRPGGLLLGLTSLHLQLLVRVLSGLLHSYSLASSWTHGRQGIGVCFYLLWGRWAPAGVEMLSHIEWCHREWQVSITVPYTHEWVLQAFCIGQSPRSLDAEFVDRLQQTFSNSSLNLHHFEECSQEMFVEQIDVCWVYSFNKHVLGMYSCWLLCQVWLERSEMLLHNRKERLHLQQCLGCHAGIEVWGFESKVKKYCLGTKQWVWTTFPAEVGRWWMRGREDWNHSKVHCRDQGWKAGRGGSRLLGTVGKLYLHTPIPPPSSHLAGLS